MSTNKTTHLNLHQWAQTDPIHRTEFNENFAHLDSAVGTLQTAIQTAGNCRIHTTSYVGTGTYNTENPNSLTFPGKPLLVFVGDRGDDGRVLYALYGMKKTFAYSSGYSLINLTWNGNMLQWSHHMSAEGQLNRSGVTYSVIALLES